MYTARIALGRGRKASKESMYAQKILNEQLVVVVLERLGEVGQRSKSLRILFHTQHFAYGPISQPRDRHQSHLPLLILDELGLLALSKCGWHLLRERGRRNAVAALVAVLEDIHIDGALRDDMVDMDLLLLAVTPTACDCLGHGRVELVLCLRQ
jgi:hypothetical protein